jgi:hypothetical protein
MFFRPLVTPVIILLHLLATLTAAMEVDPSSRSRSRAGAKAIFTSDPAFLISGNDGNLQLLLFSRRLSPQITSLTINNLRGVPLALYETTEWNVFLSCLIHMHVNFLTGAALITDISPVSECIERSKSFSQVLNVWLPGLPHPRKSSEFRVQPELVSLY